MKIILKDNFIYLANSDPFTGEFVEVEVDKQYVDNVGTMNYSLDGISFKPFGDTITINKLDLKSNDFVILIKNRIGNKTETYKSDKLPILNTIMLGGSIEDTYPDIVKTMLKRCDRMEDIIKAMKTYIDMLERKGNLL